MPDPTAASFFHSLSAAWHPAYINALFAAGLFLLVLQRARTRAAPIAQYRDLHLDLRTLHPVSGHQ